tara:strand:- start:3084 stop:3968 length:885 start_codon:yes stop_codon:yes gene_type:complete
MSYLKKHSKICIGSANFDARYGINKKKSPTNSTLKKIFFYAKSKKINFIDTAINYEGSENKIGRLGHKNINIITKIPKIPDNLNNIEKWVIDNTFLSCKRLNVKKLYGLLIHDTKDLKDKKKSKAIFKAFDYLLKHKVVKKIGLSIYNPQELDLYLKKYNFKIIQAPINVLDRRMISSGWTKKLKKEKIEIFARSIFLKGLLLKDSIEIPKIFSKWKNNFKLFEEWVEKNNLTKIEACIRFVNDLKEVDKIIIGINNEIQLKNNFIHLQKKKLNVPKNISVNSGNILNPKKWKI